MSNFEVFASATMKDVAVWEPQQQTRMLQPLLWKLQLQLWKLLKLQRRMLLPLLQNGM